MASVVKLWLCGSLIHHFKVWPHSEIPMLVEKENGNRWDRHAMTVSYPAFKDIPSSLRHEWARIPDNDKVAGCACRESSGRDKVSHRKGMRWTTNLLDLCRVMFLPLCILDPTKWTRQSGPPVSGVQRGIVRINTHPTNGQPPKTI